MSQPGGNLSLALLISQQLNSFITLEIDADNITFLQNRYMECDLLPCDCATFLQIEEEREIKALSQIRLQLSFRCFSPASDVVALAPVGCTCHLSR